MVKEEARAPPAIQPGRNSIVDGWLEGFPGPCDPMMFCMGGTKCGVVLYSSNALDDSITAAA
eukprot:6478532-Amphidinium_carterae.1